MLGYLERSKTITGVQYSYFGSFLFRVPERNLLDWLTKIRRQSTILNLSCCPLDSAPSSYIMFPNMENWFSKKKLYVNEDVYAETNAHCAIFYQSDCSKGFQKLKIIRPSCLPNRELPRNLTMVYFEKNYSFGTKVPLLLPLEFQ